MLKLDRNGLIPAVVQDYSTGDVLMMAYMNPESIKLTLENKQVWFYSRERGKLWNKGETSGNFLNLKTFLVDCDGDTLLLKVDPAGPACHTGSNSCFFTNFEAVQEYQWDSSGSSMFDDLFSVIEKRKADMPKGSYTSRLLEQGVERIAQKVIEEAGETALASVTGDKENLPKEIADMFYHTLVLMAASGITPNDIWDELQKRRK